MTDGFEHPEFLVQTAWLADHLADPTVRIFDCTTHLIPDPKGVYTVLPGRADFEKGHIPGAQFIDLQADLSDNTQRLRFMKPDAETFAASMRRLGVSQDNRVILYSGANVWWATRAWWLLRVFGFDNASLVLSTSRSRIGEASFNIAGETISSPVAPSRRRISSTSLARFVAKTPSESPDL